jgi:putative phosphoribosyl transferase
VLMKVGATADNPTCNVTIADSTARLRGLLDVPERTQAIVLIAQGLNSSTIHDACLANQLKAAGIAVLRFGILTGGEERADAATGRLRFDIPLLSKRWLSVTRWVRAQTRLHSLRIGYCGSSTGGVGALSAAAQSHTASAVVCHSGRLDLAGSALGDVRVPTLLVVDEGDSAALALSQRALKGLTCTARLDLLHEAQDRGAGCDPWDPEPSPQLRWFERHLLH